MFVPENRVSENRWHYLDTDAMAAALGHNALPILIDLSGQLRTIFMHSNG